MVDISFETKKYVNNKVEQSSKEIHPMRFFFYQEIKYFLSKAGLDFLKGFGNFFVYQLNFIKKIRQ